MTPPPAPRAGELRQHLSDPNPTLPPSGPQESQGASGAPSLALVSLIPLRAQGEWVGSAPPRPARTIPATRGLAPCPRPNPAPRGDPRRPLPVPASGMGASPPRPSPAPRGPRVPAPAHHAAQGRVPALPPRPPPPPGDRQEDRPQARERRRGAPPVTGTVREGDRAGEGDGGGGGGAGGVAGVRREPSLLGGRGGGAAAASRESGGKRWL